MGSSRRTGLDVNLEAPRPTGAARSFDDRDTLVREAVIGGFRRYYREVMGFAGRAA